MNKNSKLKTKLSQASKRAVKHKTQKGKAPRISKVSRDATKPARLIKTPHGQGAAKTPDAKKKIERKRTNQNIMAPEVVKGYIEQIIASELATEYLRKNVSKAAVDVLAMLAAPKTDEYLAEQLGMKINAIRRMLNIMQGYGITNYYVSKNDKGWLSFAWYINTSKVPPFLQHITDLETEKVVSNSTCNDYFMCEKCYKDDKMLYTFDTAFDITFKCTCGNNLTSVDKNRAEELVRS